MYSQEAERIKFNEIEHRKAVRELIAETVELCDRANLDDKEILPFIIASAASYRALRAELLSAMQRIDSMQDYGNDNMSAIITLIENLRNDEMAELEMHVAHAV